MKSYSYFFNGISFVVRKGVIIFLLAKMCCKKEKQKPSKKTVEVILFGKQS